MLEVTKSGGWLVLDFPADTLEPVGLPEGLKEALGGKPRSCWRGLTDYMVVYDTEEEIRALNPNYHLLDQIPARGIIVTSPGREHDFVSRFFAPNCGIPEDPVTGIDYLHAQDCTNDFGFNGHLNCPHGVGCFVANWMGTA